MRAAERELLVVTGAPYAVRMSFDAKATDLRVLKHRRGDLLKDWQTLREDLRSVRVKEDLLEHDEMPLLFAEG